MIMNEQREDKDKNKNKNRKKKGEPIFHKLIQRRKYCKFNR